LAEHVLQRGASAQQAAPKAPAPYHALNPALETLGSLDPDSAKAIAYVKAHPPHTRTLQYTPVSSVEAAVREVKEQGFAVWPGFITAERAGQLAEALEPLWSDTENQPGVNGPEHKLTGRNLSTLLARTRAADDVPSDARFMAMMDGLLQEEAGVVTPDNRPGRRTPSQLGHSSAKDVLDLERQQDLHQDGVIYPVPPDVRRALDHPMFVNTLLTLDHFTVENAATRFVPGSHKWYDAAPRFRGIPPHYEPNDVEFVTPEAAPGTLMIFVRSPIEPRLRTSKGSSDHLADRTGTSGTVVGRS